MWIMCNETINLGGGKFIAPDKKVQVPDVLGKELVAKSVALEIETEPLTNYVASQQGNEVDLEVDEEVVEGAEVTTADAEVTTITDTTVETTIVNDATGK